MLAAPLVHALAAAPGLRAFLEHAHELRREYKVDSEDVALGYWLAKLQSTPMQYVQYVQMPPNSVSNVDCFQNTGMYQAR